jgi:hypothetical protein
MLCSQAGRYDNPPTRFLAPIECIRIPALKEGGELATTIKTPSTVCSLQNLISTLTQGIVDEFDGLEPLDPALLLHHSLRRVIYKVIFLRIYTILIIRH